MKLTKYLQKYPGILVNSLRGIEREALRTTKDGFIAESPHPKGLGSSLTNKYITTDYSEAMVELITPPCKTIEEAFSWLKDIHKFTVDNLENGEFLWNCSMPCIIDCSGKVPPARFGTSNEGKFKELYRLGLKHRFGSKMQSISGIHFNFSFPEELWKSLQEKNIETFSTSPEETGNSPKSLKTRAYLHTARNFLRYNWLPMLLFGATPAMCTTYLEPGSQGLQSINRHTAYKPWATSLRSSSSGYQSNAQEELFIPYNTLLDYCKALSKATMTKWGPFSKMYARNPDCQINGAILQIENEYYSPVRPKQASMKTPRSTTGLWNQGIEYLEIRSTDINPFSPWGISTDQIHFLESLLLMCLLKKSPALFAEEMSQIKANNETIASAGRTPGQTIQSPLGDIPLTTAAEQLMADIATSAAILDAAYQTNSYTIAFNQQQEKIRNFSLLPSARIIQSIKETNEFFFATMRQTIDSMKRIQDHEIPENQRIELQKAATCSIMEQNALEEISTLSFEEFVENQLKSPFLTEEE